jgi:D-aminoacyl-tRNA deacylase
MLGIVVSRADSASVHIGEQLRALADWESYEDDGQPAAEGGGTVYETAGAELREFETRHLDLVEPAAAFGDIDLLVFASKHSGETGPLLTAHHTGNIGTAVHGGADHSLAEPAPHALRTVYELLADHAPSGYDVGIECTHHGPSNVGAPSMFVEVGSAQPQWDDPEAARGVAQAILDLRDVVPHCPTDNGNETRRQLLGIGGGHYAPRFERIIQETDWTVGHILADWGLDEADIDTATLTAVLEQAFEAGKTAYALVEDDRPKVLDRIEALGYRAVSETWVRETEGVPLGLVGDLESTVCPVEDGLRFGDAARGDSVPDTYDVVELPTALVDEARGIDRAQMSDELVATADGHCRPRRRDDTGRSCRPTRLAAGDKIRHHRTRGGRYRGAQNRVQSRESQNARRPRRPCIRKTRRWDPCRRRRRDDSARCCPRRTRRRVLALVVTPLFRVEIPTLTEPRGINISGFFVK